MRSQNNPFNPSKMIMGTGNPQALGDHPDPFVSFCAGRRPGPFPFSSNHLPCGTSSAWRRSACELEKMIGMAAGLLLLIQLPLAGRLKALDRIFSLPAFMGQHRIHAWAIFVLAFLHPVFCSSRRTYDRDPIRGTLLAGVDRGGPLGFRLHSVCHQPVAEATGHCIPPVVDVSPFHWIVVGNSPRSSRPCM